MNRTLILLVVMGCLVVTLAQPATSQNAGQNSGSQPYQPAVPAPSINAYGGYPTLGGGGGTAAGSAMNGMSNVISAKGNYNLSTSAAALNMTQVRTNSIKNQQLAANTYFEMKDANKAWQAKQTGPTPTQEQLARWARETGPKPISPSQLDPASGKINWPGLLQEDSYAAQRGDLDRLSAKKATYGGLVINEQLEARKVIETMFAQLKSTIRDVPAADYIASRNFLRSLIYAMSNTGLG